MRLFHIEIIPHSFDIQNKKLNLKDKQDSKNYDVET